MESERDQAGASSALAYMKEESMNGIYIKGVEPPICCGQCSEKIDPDNRRCLADGHIFEETLGKLTNRRDANCPIIHADDVREVRRGKWTRIDYEPFGHDYICSICGIKNDRASFFCPGCGADMRESTP